jgi:hypothetical protein
LAITYRLGGAEDEPARCIDARRPPLVAKKMLQLIGLVEDLDSLVLVPVVQAPQVQIRSVTGDVGVRDLAGCIRVVAVVDEEHSVPRCQAGPHQPYARTKKKEAADIVPRMGTASTVKRR